MLIWGHEKITKKALKHTFLNDNKPDDKKYSNKIKFICKANTDADLFAHNYTPQHYTDGPILEGLSFANKAQEIVIDEFVKASDCLEKDKEQERNMHFFMALYAFGRMSHVVQDFYAHTNWINLTGPKKRVWNENTETPNIDKPELLKNCISEGEFSERFLKLIRLNKNFYEKTYLSENSKPIPHALMGKDYKGALACRIFKKINGKDGYTVAKIDAKAHTKKKWQEIIEAVKDKTGTKYNKFKQRLIEFEPPKDKRERICPKIRKEFDSRILAEY